jgi:hypothetical protein
MTGGPYNGTVATLPYVNTSSGRSEHTLYVFGATVPVAAGREIAAITLPSNGALPSSGRNQGVHIFAPAAE